MPYLDRCKQREYQRNWIATRRQAFFDGKECKECKSPHVLELHHIDPDQKVSHRIWSWSETRRNTEISKCEILCESCHMEKTIKYCKDRALALPVLHGKASTYRHRACRCLECREAYSVVRREQYLRTGT